VNDSFDVSSDQNFEGEINPRYCECDNGKPAYNEKCWVEGAPDCRDCDHGFDLVNGVCVIDEPGSGNDLFVNEPESGSYI